MGIDLSLGVPIIKGLPVPMLSGITAEKLIRYPRYFTERELNIVKLTFLLGKLETTYSNCTVHNGARSALTSALMCLKDLGINKAITPRPFWPGYSSIFLLADIELDSYSTKEEFPETVAYLICLPNNPNGERNFRLLKSYLESGSWVVIDCVYFGFLTDKEKIEFIEILTPHSNYTLVFSASKYTAAPNIRIGYTFSKDTHFSERIKEKQFSISNMPSDLNREIACDLLECKERVVKIRDYYIRICSRINPLKNRFNINFTAYGMFLWVETKYANSSITAHHIKNKLNIIGTEVGEFGTRWLLIEGINYESILNAIEDVDCE